MLVEIVNTQRLQPTHLCIAMNYSLEKGKIYAYFANLIHSTCTERQPESHRMLEKIQPYHEVTRCVLDVTQANASSFSHNSVKLRPK